MLPSIHRYTPRKGDQVVGIIEERGVDFYVVNIFSGAHCVLNRLAFEGATKRSKPELKKGDLIYARVIVASDPTQEDGGLYETRDTELTCLTATGPKKEWNTGETIYGELPVGVLINVPLLMAKKLLHHDCVVLNALGSNYSFEVAVGMNGAVWIRAKNAIETIIIRNAIINSQYLKSDAHIIAMVEKLISMSKKFK